MEPTDNLSVPSCMTDSCLQILQMFSQADNGLSTIQNVFHATNKTLNGSHGFVVLRKSMSDHAEVPVASGCFNVLHSKNIFSLFALPSPSIPKHHPYKIFRSEHWSFSLIGDDHAPNHPHYIVDAPLFHNDHLLGYWIFEFPGSPPLAEETHAFLVRNIELMNIAVLKWTSEKDQEHQIKLHASAERRLKKQNRFLNTLYRISLDMVNQRNYERLINSILSHAQRIMDANFSSLYLVNEALGILEMKFIGPGVDPSVLSITIKPGQGGAGKVWETGQFLIINDYPNWGNRVHLSWLDGIGTIAFVPLFYFNKMIGIICLGFADIHRRVDSSERALLQQFANLSAMVSENVRLMNVLEKKNADATNDVRLAAEVQRTFLPGNYHDSRLEIRTYYSPLQQVSGDLYDYFWLLQGDVLFGYVADVTGHGVTAGLRTSAISALFREAAPLPFGLSDKLKWVHGHSLGYFSEGAYFAAICFEIDFTRHELRVACAGLYEFFIRTDYFTGRIEMSGSLLGLKRTPSFDERTFPIAAGDCFYFLTDGFTENMSKENFPLADHAATLEWLDLIRDDPSLWDDASGLCLQWVPNEPKNLPAFSEMLFSFTGYQEFHESRQKITSFIESQIPLDADDVLIAFHEAAGNALRHGSLMQPVCGRIRIYGNRITLRINDAGVGFDAQSVLAQSFNTDLTAASLPARQSGRGIPIMLGTMNRVCFNQKGNQVLLQKSLTRPG